MAIGGLAVPAATTTPALAGTNATQGTDVSSLQHPTATSTIDWTDVASSGMDFTGIKASEGNYYTNPYYAGNVTKSYEADAAQAVAAGLYVTPYVFANPYDSTSTGNGTAAQQADDGAKVIKASTSPAYSGSHLLPVTLDIEPDPYVNSEKNSNQCYGLSQSAMRTWISQFITEIKKDLPTSKAPIIYTTADWWNACTGNDTAFSADPLWLASYGVANPALPAGWNNYTIWQYGGGTVSGISGSDTDLDYLGPVLQVSQAGKAIGPLQLRTLTSLAGTASTYSSSSLPAGLTISSSGQITGTPTTAGIGSHTVTVTTSGVPSSMSFTWIVHGTITVTSPGSRTTTAGTPVSLQIPVADQDGSGYTLAVSGLPSGLTMNSAGLITGWPTKPGTYTVRVSASDALYASGSATFTWTVKAASDSGYTGPVKQVGGTGKCLDDPASATANGTKVDLWSCNGKSNQSWTVAQDGTIRVLGKCLAESGTTVELWACGSQFSDQEWRPGTNGGLVNEQSGDCLYFKGANAVNGSKPTMAPCSYTNLSGEEWSRPAANVFSGEPGKCLAASGSAVSVPTCANVASQHWVAAANGTLQLGTDCLTAPSGATTGSVLTYGSCSGTAAMWTLLDPQDGIATEFESAATSGLCATASGTQVILEACSTVPADTWRIQ
jgi:GH25 family lysozyme M1 (1,4-beta-N-acetylmuramidase)